MAKQKQEIGIKESFGIIKKSDSPATPLTEGLINSLDAIKQRQDRKDTFTPKITISLINRIMLAIRAMASTFQVRKK